MRLIVTLILMAITGLVVNGSHYVWNTDIFIRVHKWGFALAFPAAIASIIHGVLRINALAEMRAKNAEKTINEQSRRTLENALAEIKRMAAQLQAEKRGLDELCEKYRATDYQAEVELAQAKALKKQVLAERDQVAAERRALAEKARLLDQAMTEDQSSEPKNTTQDRSRGEARRLKRIKQIKEEANDEA